MGRREKYYDIINIQTKQYQLILQIYISFVEYIHIKYKFWNKNKILQL